MKIFLSLLCSTSSLAYASGAIGNGPRSIKGQTVKTAEKYNGPVGVSHSTFDQDIEIRGPLGIDDSTVNGKMLVYGPVGAHRSKFNAALEVHGPLGVSDCTFKAEVAANGNVGLSHSSIAGKLTVAADQGGKEPHVCLADNSQVGSIEFRGAKGKVFQTDKGSQVKAGVTNGEVVQQSCPQG